MKKLLTLILALLLVVGLSVPAMAFTSDTQADDDGVPYDLKIYLVEYDDNDFFGIASLPKSDRGYAKNEIVAAVVELYVPDDAITIPDNQYLILSGENVDLDVAENYDGANLSFQKSFDFGFDANVSTPMWDSDIPFPSMSDHEAIYIQIINLAGKATCRWLFFAKVTGDDASLTAKLKDGMFPDSEMNDIFPVSLLTLDGVQYPIQRVDNVGPDKDILYIIPVGPESDYFGAYIWINTDKNHKSLGMIITAPENSERAILGVNTKGELGVARESNPAVLLTDGDFYDNAMDVYNYVVVGVFGLDYMLIGNYVRDSFFEDLVSPKTLIATVDIAPWTAYVTVPDNIVVDPPKTGDAASVMGFVMVALSGAGVVALRKRG